jgi:hypothetical protein
MGERRGVYRVSVGNLRERDHLGDPGVDERIILRGIFRKWEGIVGTGWSGLRIGQVAGTCECGDERSGSIKCEEFFDQTENRLASQVGLCSME